MIPCRGLRCPATAMVMARIRAVNCRLYGAMGSTFAPIRKPACPD